MDVFSSDRPITGRQYAVTTTTISVPSVGIGGLTGLPLGLAASDIARHDSYDVVGHFHCVVAPGTLFAIFAGVYTGFPKAPDAR